MKWSAKFLKFAKSPKASWWLAILAFTESSFFPIPPDLMLIPMALEQKKKALKYALICTSMSTLGGILGYYIGHFFMDSIGQGIINFYGIEDKYLEIKNLFNTHGLWAIAIAGFTPIPYKLFTIASGVFSFSLLPFVLVSFLTRGARFFLLALSLSLLGDRARTFIEKKFDLISLAIIVLLVVSYVVLKYFNN